MRVVVAWFAAVLVIVLLSFMAGEVEARHRCGHKRVCTPTPIVTPSPTATPTPIPPTPTPRPEPNFLVIVRVYDYTHLNRDGAVRAAVEYYDSILYQYGYRFEYYRMPYMADGLACRSSANVTPLPGVKACETYDPAATIAASSVGRTWVDNGDGNWAITSWFHIYSGTRDPAVVGAGGSFHHHACHELGHIWGTLPHWDGYYPSCLNVTRWTIDGQMLLGITDEEIALGLRYFPTTPPPSAGATS